MEARPRVLLTSCEDWLAYAHVPGLLHRAGAHVTFLGAENAWPLRGSFVDSFVRAEPEPARHIATLERHLRRERYTLVVLGDDTLLRALAARADEPWVAPLLPVPAREPELGLLGSKVAFVRAAGALGLDIPPSRVCTGRSELREALREVGTPALIKEDVLSGGMGCHYVADERALEALPAHVLNTTVALQAFITGHVHAVEALYDRGNLRAVLTSRMLRTWPEPFGPSSLRHFAHDPRVVGLTDELGRKTSLHGFANISIIEDPRSGALWLIELDARPNAFFHLADRLGVRMIESLRALITGAPIADVHHLAPDYAREVAAFPNDLLRCFLAPDLTGLAAWACGRDQRWQLASPQDLRMTYALTRHIVRQVAKGALSRLRPD